MHDAVGWILQEQLDVCALLYIVLLIGMRVLGPCAAHHEYASGQVEDKTPFSRWYTPGAAPLPTDEAAADMFRTASCKLSSAGYEHYEISSFARPGKR